MFCCTVGQQDMMRSREYCQRNHICQEISLPECLNINLKYTWIPFGQSEHIHLRFVKKEFTITIYIFKRGVIICVNLSSLFTWDACSLVQMDCEAMLEVKDAEETELNDFTTSPVLRSNPRPSFSYKKMMGRISY